jgi:NADH:ubiquinone oxidoreductase subunit C
VIFEQLAGGTAVAEVFGEGATAAEAFGLLTVDVPAASWTGALTAARDVLGCTWFDWLSAVDEPGRGFHVVAHLVALGTPVRRLLVRTLVPADAPALPTAVGVYAGAAWHERETHEMFGVDFPGHPHLAPLLLPEEFEGYPLRKEFVLAARVAKAWPGAKEPGEPDHPGPRRRQMLPPGVPDPDEWGPLKGTLGPEPAGRPARGAAARGGDGPPGERPARPARADRPRRTRSASQGSASQTAGPASTPDKPWEAREGRGPGPGGGAGPGEPGGGAGAGGGEAGPRGPRGNGGPRASGESGESGQSGTAPGAGEDA